MPKKDSIEKLLKYAAMDGVGTKQNRVIERPVRYNDSGHKFLLGFDIWRGKYNVKRHLLFQWYRESEPFPDNHFIFYENLKKYLIYNEKKKTFLVDTPMWVIKMKLQEVLKNRHEEDT